MVDAGVLRNEDDLKNHPEFFPAIFNAWIRGGQLGCLFATILARRDDAETNWLSISIDGPLTPRILHENVNEVLLATDTPPEALSILFPGLRGVDDVMKLINGLCEDFRWGWEEIENPEDNRLLIGLRWLLPSGRSGSWVLGFVPLDSMPFTRRAPLTALVMRVKDSGRKHPKGTIDNVHLADLRQPHAKKPPMIDYGRKRKNTKSGCWPETPTLRRRPECLFRCRLRCGLDWCRRSSTLGRARGTRSTQNE